MSFVEQETDQPTRRRKSNDEVVDRIAVRRAMADILKDIEGLQHETVFLKAQLARHPTAHEQFIPRMITLGQGIRQSRVKLERAVGSLTERQRGHGRVQDVHRALAALEQAMPRLAVEGWRISS